MIHFSRTIRQQLFADKSDSSVTVSIFLEEWHLFIPTTSTGETQDATQRMRLFLTNIVFIQRDIIFLAHKRLLFVCGLFTPLFVVN